MWPTVIIASLVAVVFSAIVIRGIINRKKGRYGCSCGGSCGTCGMNCHGRSDAEREN